MESPTWLVEVGFATTNPLTQLSSVTWTDITAYVRSIRTNRGRQHQLQEFEAGTAEIELDNSDRRFDPTNTSSPYSPNVRPLRRVRISAVYASVTYRRFTGYVESWDPTYEGIAKSSTMLKAIDALAITSLFEPRTLSVYAYEVAKDAPYLHWRLGESSGRTAEDQSPNNRDGTYDAGVALGQTGLLAEDPDKAVLLTEKAGVVGGDVASFERTVAFTVELIVRIARRVETTLPYVVGRIVPSTSRGWHVRMVGGLATFVLTNTALAVNQLTDDLRTYIDDGKQHLLAFTYDGSSTAAGIRGYLDGVERETRSAIATLSATIVDSAGIFRLGNPGGAIASLSHSADEVAVYQSELTAARMLAHYDAMTAPWINQRSSERITALLDLMGWPAADRDIRTGVATLDLVRGGLRSMLEHARDVAQTELGAFYIAADGKIRFDDRYVNIQASTPAATFGDDGSELDYSKLEPVYDLTDLWTEVQATRAGGAVGVASDATAKAEFGTRVLPWDGLWIDDEQPKAVAEKLLTAYKAPTLRFRALELEPVSAAVTVEMLSRDLNRDRFVVKRRPPGGGPVISQDVVIEGIADDVALGRWKTTWRLATAEPAVTYHTVGTTLLTTGTAGLAY